MATAIHKIYVGAGGNPFSPQVLGNCAYDRSRASTAAKTIKNAYSHALFSSVTAATELLGLNDNGFKTAKKGI